MYSVAYFITTEKMGSLWHNIITHGCYNNIFYITAQWVNKAPDIFGISSKHVRLADTTVIQILTYLRNAALHTGELPDSFKLSALHLVAKKKKSQKLPNNHRHITITSIVGKLVEIHSAYTHAPYCIRPKATANLFFPRTAHQSLQH